MSGSTWLEASGEAMWTLAERYTGHVGYKGGIKAAGLRTDPPVIDCSGWVALLLASGMEAANSSMRTNLFDSDDISAVHTWSDHMIEVLERRSGWLLAGDEITVNALPSFATIGLRQGGGAWAKNHPRPRGITHVVQLVRRPRDGARFVSESQGWAEPYGLRLLPLSDWFGTTRDLIARGEAWAVNAFTQIDGSSASRSRP